MTSERFTRLRDIVLTLPTVPEEERPGYLRHVCSGDAELHREAESLLRVDSSLLPDLVRTGGALTLFGAEPVWRSDEVPKRVGQYNVLNVLGRGGMGVVCRAHDTRLGRDVALKLLPHDLAAHPERVARFRREAHLLATLNHPHIAHVYGLEGEEDAPVLVMELIEGISLAARLVRGPLPLAESLRIACQMASAIEKAHESNIVHRDLKPANVMLTPDGDVKLLDFGIAKAVAAAAVETPPEGVRMEAHPAVLGTAAYMSPEQARGAAVDRRTDIWSFGCVVYEMLAGQAAFHGETILDTLVSVLTRDPAWNALPRDTPPPVRLALGRCLRRALRERLRDIGDARFAMEDALLGDAPTTIPARRTATQPVRIRSITFSGHDNLPSASPDGRFVAFASDRDGTLRIWIKDLTTGGEQPLSSGHDTNPRFSPDGASVLFLRTEGNRQSVYRQALVGGHALKSLDDALEASWFADGRAIAFIRRSDDGTALSAADGAGGESVLFRTPRQLYGLRCARAGRRAVAVESPPTGKSEGYGLVVVEYEAGTARASRVAIPGPPISGPAWSGVGEEIVFAQAGSTLGDYGDPLARVLLRHIGTGAERTLFYAEGLFPTLGRWSLGRGTALDVVGPGTIVFGANHVRQTLREVSLKGASAFGCVLPGESRDRQPAYAPDGGRIFFSSNRSGNLGLWGFDLARGELRQVTDDRARHWDPALTADGRFLLWSSDRSGNLEIWMSHTDGSGSRQVTHDGHDAQNPSATPDGRWIVYWSAHPEKAGIWKIRPDGRDATQLVAGNLSLTEVSPDGRWAAFLSQEPHNLQSAIGLVEIETGQTRDPPVIVQWPSTRSEDVVIGRFRWMPHGRTIAFIAPDERGRLGIAAQAIGDDGRAVGPRSLLAGFDDAYASESFAFSPDGTRVMLSCMEKSQRVMIAEDVPGVGARRRAGR